MASNSNDLNISQILEYSEKSSVYDIDAINDRLINTINIIAVNSLSSTNTVLKNLAQQGIQDKTVLIADSQTKGRGRIGKSFESPKGTGIYMSVLLRKHFEVDEVGFITPAVAVAIVKALDKYNSDLKIKWVNDIYLNDKKICGILTESSFDHNGDYTEYVIIGIGVNLTLPTNGFSDEIKDVAAALFKDNNSVDNNVIAAEILNSLFNVFDNLDHQYISDEYKVRSYLDGKQVSVIRGKDRFNATVIGLDDKLNLIVKTQDNNVFTLSSGEVSVRAT